MVGIFDPASATRQAIAEGEVNRRTGPVARCPVTLMVRGIAPRAGGIPVPRLDPEFGPQPGGHGAEAGALFIAAMFLRACRSRMFPKCRGRRVPRPMPDRAWNVASTRERSTVTTPSDGGRGGREGCVAMARRHSERQDGEACDPAEPRHGTSPTFRSPAALRTMASITRMFATASSRGIGTSV